jgi:hypothetical protein
MGELRATVLVECPYCGGTSGYYDCNVTRYEQHYTFDGAPAHASDPDHVRGGLQKFCSDCGRRLRCLEPERG